MQQTIAFLQDSDKTSGVKRPRV